jgi:hypothetical protein
MAKFVGEMPDELIKMFETLAENTDALLGEMVKAGAEVAKKNVTAKMPKALKEGLDKSGAVRVTRVYRTPSDDGINCQVTIEGYFINRDKRKTPAPLVANLFEYGRSGAPYPKQPFLRPSFNASEITKAMLEVQDKYIKDDDRAAKNLGKLFRSKRENW